MSKIINEKLKDKFKKNSVIFLKNLFSRELCKNTVIWLENNEHILIERFKDKKRGLVTESYRGKDCIKYFEYPLYSNPEIFSKFMNSTIFKYASTLLEKEVIFKSLEIHSRFPGAKLIPLHQDNAYYGLEDANALTFYIAINQQSSSLGGLTYLSLNKSSEVSKHIPSESSGFSLEIDEKDKAFLNKSLCRFDYEPGDCSIHHSVSMHYAEEVPLDSERCWVVRFSFFAEDTTVSLSHKEFYKKMIEQNRKLN